MQILDSWCQVHEWLDQRLFPTGLPSTEGSERSTFACYRSAQGCTVGSHDANPPSWGLACESNGQCVNFVCRWHQTGVRVGPACLFFRQHPLSNTQRRHLRGALGAGRAAEGLVLAHSAKRVW